MNLPHSDDGKWRISPSGDPAADIVMTAGITLARADRITISKKPIVIETNNDDSHVGLLLSVQSDENGYTFITNDGIYVLNSFSAPPSFTMLTSTSAPAATLGRDGVIFNGLLHVGGGSFVKSHASNTWTSRVTGLDSNYPVRLCNFENKVNLAVGNKNTVQLYDTSYSLIATMTLPVEYIVTGIIWRLNTIYILTRNISGGTARLFTWNGSGNNYQYGYGVQADWIYSGCEYADAIAIITSAGQLLLFTGTGFQELANLPVYSTPYSWSSSASLVNGTGKVASRGMTAIGKRLLINLDGSVTVQGGGFPGVYMPEQPSGVWEFTPDNGLRHRAGYCHTKYSTITATEIGSNRLVLSAAHGLSTGDAVYIKTLGALTGVLGGQTYFAIVEGPNAFSLALSPSDAYDDKPITLAGAANTTVVCVETTNEIGARLITAPGAIGTFNKNIENAFFGTDIFFGGETPDDAGSNTFSFMSLGLGRSRGTVTTNRLPNQGITGTYGDCTLFLNDLVSDFDKVVVKSRIQKLLGKPTQVSISGISMVTWISSTVFTALVANRDLEGVVEDDECTIIQGAGAGYTANVVSAIKSSDGTTWTVTLDEAIGNIANGNRSEVQFDNWKQHKVINNEDTHISQGYATVSVDRKSAWAELKFELRGRDVSLDRAAISISADNQSK